MPETKEAYSRAVKSYTSLMKKIQDTHTHVTSRASAYSFQRMRLERQAMKGEVEVMSLWIYCMEVWCELLGDVEEELKDEVLLLGEGL